TVRGRAVHESERGARGAHAIILTEIPVLTSVDTLAGKVGERGENGQRAGEQADLVETGTSEGARDIPNESGQGQTRLVIDLRTDTNPQIVLNNLFKHKTAPTTFPAHMGALVGRLR